jgi:hypothetical protein
MRDRRISFDLKLTVARFSLGTGSPVFSSEKTWLRRSIIQARQAVGLLILAKYIRKLIIYAG